MGFGFSPNGRPDSFSVSSDSFIPTSVWDDNEQCDNLDKDYGLWPEIAIRVATTAYGGCQFGEGTRRDH